MFTWGSTVDGTSATKEVRDDASVPSAIAHHTTGAQSEEPREYCGETPRLLHVADTSTASGH